MYPWNKAGVAANFSSIQTHLSKIRSYFHVLRFRVPLTLPGTLTLALALYLLFHGLANRNAYGILLGVVLTLLLGILLGIGYVVSRASETLTPTWQIPTPVRASEFSSQPNRAGSHEAVASPLSNKPPSVNASSLTKSPLPDHKSLAQPSVNLHRIRGIPKVPLFFRVHFEVRGKLTLGDRKVLFYSADWSSQTGVKTGERNTNSPAEITGSLPFALSGQFQGMGYRTLRDIFGLVRFNLPPVLHRSFAVLPAPSRKQIQLRLDPSLGLEEKRTLRNADEERYFMREYAPGDRFRDINWKTSSRLAFLITRVAPQSQEKTRILPVAFRCFGPSKPDLSALWTLDRCKAWLFQFLWTVRREHPEFVLRVTTPLIEEELTTDQETERFCEEIVGHTYRTLEEEGRFAFLTAAPEEVFVFSTSFDGGLPRFAGARFDQPTHLYVTIPLRRFIGSAYVGKKDLPISSLPTVTFSLKQCVREGGILVPHILLPSPIPSLPTPRPLRGTLEIELAEVSL